MFSLKIFSVATKRMKVFYELVNVFKTSYLEYIVINVMNIYLYRQTFNYNEIDYGLNSSCQLKLFFQYWRLIKVHIPSIVSNIYFTDSMI